MKMLVVGETFEAEHPLPLAGLRRTVSFTNPHVARGQIDGDTVKVSAESPGVASYVVQYLTREGLLAGSEGEMFTVVAPVVAKELRRTRRAIKKAARGKR